MSDGISDSLVKDHNTLEEYRLMSKAREIQDSIRKSIEDTYTYEACTELPTPECFPHQGKSLAVMIPDANAEVSVHVTAMSESTMMVSVSRDIVISSTASMDDIKNITNFINDIAYHGSDAGYSE